MKKYKINCPLDSPQRTLLHGEIIKKKVFLRKLYAHWYSLLLHERNNIPSDVMIELGSGGGFIKEIEPSVICTDVIDLPTNDMTFSALDMPFTNNSVGAILMIDTMHHIPDSEQFLKEATRVLAKTGKMIMIEPANSLWGRFIYKNFHHEPFDTKGGWVIPTSGPLSGANGALPWIVFVRDNELFTQKFPNLKIDSIEYLNPLTYLLSGGLSRGQFLPNMTISMVLLLDKVLPKISKHFSMFMLVRISRC